MEPMEPIGPRSDGTSNNAALIAGIMAAVMLLAGVVSFILLADTDVEQAPYSPTRVGGENIVAENSDTDDNVAIQTSEDSGSEQSPENCAWIFAYDEDINSQRAIASAFEFSEISIQPTVDVSAFGEDYDCYDSDNNLVSTEFYLMNITVDLTFEVSDSELADEAFLGQLLRRSLVTIITTDTSRVESIAAEFISGDSPAIRWQASYDTVVDVLAEDVSNQELFDLGVQN